MRIETALDAGRTGLDVHGQAIGMVSDNIANDATTGFKSSRIEFADLLPEGMDGYQSTADAPIGCGAVVSAVRQVWDSGLLEQTGRQLDAGIDGEGFFLVGDVANPMYSRAGNFAIDAKGLLVNSSGDTILGVLPGGTGLSTINMYAVNSSAGVATSKGTLVGNLNASSAMTSAPTNPATFSEIAQAASYMSTMTVYDSLGKSHDVSLAFFKTAANTWTAQAYLDGAEVGGTAGTPVQIGSNGSLAFSTSGVSSNAAAAVITANPNYSNGAAAGNFTIDLSQFTQYAAASGLANVTQDGRGVGNVKGYEILSDGRLVANLDSGASQLIATLQLAYFVNKDGLQRVGDTMYLANKDAGTVSTGNPGTGIFGKLQGGTLEHSNVDLATQFVNLVIYQRGYQANSQTVNVTNQILKDTIQLMH